MANNDTPFGLRPIRHRNGAPYNGACNPYYKAVGLAEAFYVGDAVIKAGSSNTAYANRPGMGGFNVGCLPTVQLATVGDGNRITGVVVGVGANPDNLNRIYSPSATEDIIWVCDDPDVIFEIQADGAIPAASIGLNAVLIATNSGDTDTGISGLELDTTSDAPAADASNQLVIMRAVNREDNDTTLTHAKVEVMINQHTENQGTVGTLGI